MRLLFYKDAFGLFERLIQLVTWSRFVHVELAVAHGPGWALVWSSSNRDGGVRLRRIDVRPEAWESVDIGNHPGALAWFAAHEGQKYDWLGVLRFVLPFLPHRRRQWFCSEAVAAALGLPDPHKWTPADLHRWALAAAPPITQREGAPHA